MCRVSIVRVDGKKSQGGIKFGWQSILVAFSHEEDGEIFYC